MKITSKEETDVQNQRIENLEKKIERIEKNLKTKFKKGKKLYLLNLHVGIFLK